MGSNTGAQRRGCNERGSKASYAAMSSLHKYTPFKGAKTRHIWRVLRHIWRGAFYLFVICETDNLKNYDKSYQLSELPYIKVYTTNYLSTCSWTKRLVPKLKRSEITLC